MKIYGTIEKSEKQDDGTIIVTGFASSEAVDSDGEVIKADAIKAAIPAYMKFANVREMHKADKASGVVLEMEVQADGRTWVKTHIVDAEACKKVNAKVYKGFSIGGRVTERDEDDKKIIKGITLNELSLVDRPANPEAVFSFGKVDAGDEAAAAAQENEGGKPADEAKPDAPVDAPKEETKTVEPQKEGETTDKPAEGEGEKEASAKAGDLKKGMWAVQNLASILSSIQSLQECSEWEAESEGDGSTMPAELMAWLKAGGALLSAMVTEEVAEMVDDGTVIVDVIALADKAKNLMKAACSAEDAEKFAKGLDALTSRRKDLIAKAGARNSAADQKHLNAIHDAACAMGAACDSEKSAGTGDLTKRAKDAEAIATKLAALEGDDVVEKVGQLIEISETLAKRVAHLEAQPKPPKAIVKAHEKTGDTPTPELKATETVTKSDTPTEAMKKVWMLGGKVG